MSFKTLLFGLALGAVAMNLYGKSRPWGSRRAGEPIDRDVSLTGDAASAGLSGEPRPSARTDDLLSPGDEPSAASPTPESTVAERF